MKWQLGQIMMDIAVKWGLAGIGSTSQAPCRICRGQANGQRVEDDEFDRRSTFSDEESQRPL